MYNTSHGTVSHLIEPHLIPTQLRRRREYNGNIFQIK